MGYFWGLGRVQKLFWGLLIWTNNFCFLSFALFLLYHVVLSLCGGWWVGGWIPSDYLVSTQLQLWLFCCWGWGCCWAVTKRNILSIDIESVDHFGFFRGLKLGLFGNLRLLKNKINLFGTYLCRQSSLVFRSTSIFFHF